MARKASEPKHVETGSQEAPAPPGSQEGHGRITKSEAVRRALADGVDQPAAGVAYVKSRFGLEIGAQHFSAVKSEHLKKQGAPPVQGKGRAKKAAAAPQPSPAASTAASPANGEVGILEALEAIKPLVASLGIEKVKRLVDLLG